LVPSALSFSKHLAHHIGAICHFICGYNLTRATCCGGAKPSRAEHYMNDTTFQQRMHQRNAIEGTLSELTRGHGLRRSRYRGFGKVELQNLLIGTACNIKRWLRYLITKAKGNQTRASGLYLSVQSPRRQRSGVLAHAFWSSALSWQALPLPC
jgi:hypothetical protein